MWKLALPMVHQRSGLVEDPDIGGRPPRNPRLMHGSWPTDSTAVLSDLYLRFTRTRTVTIPSCLRRSGTRRGNHLGSCPVWRLAERSMIRMRAGYATRPASRRVTSARERRRLSRRPASVTVRPCLRQPGVLQGCRYVAGHRLEPPFGEPAGT